MILLDTNLLARLTDPSSAHCAAARRSVHVLLARREHLVIVPQNLYEFWAVATRKAGGPPGGQNGLGMSSAQASQWISFFQRRFHFLSDREELLARWHELIRRFDIKGFKAHDARLVAAMETYRIASILTFNAADFSRFPITIVDPLSI
jgi:predicted nucleic acid-binding protein